MISVLFLIPTLDRGGAENVLVDLVNHMDQTKFQITVQTLFDENSQKDRLREGIEYKSFLYHQFHGNSRLMARIPARLLYKLIVRKRYDVVVSYLEGPTTHIISGCPYKDSKKVAWVHVEMKNQKQLSVGFRSLEEAKKAYEDFDKVIFVAETVKDSFMNVCGSSYPNGCVLYNTIDSETIMEKAQKQTESVPFEKDEFNIVSVGRIIRAKGYDRLASVQKRLSTAGYKTHIYILGTGADQEGIMKYAEEQGISDTFSFLGFQDNPYPIIAKADLFVCSSRREGFSTAVTEALILGVPVVSTNCSGAYELLGENNEYGIVTENSTKALYEGIRNILHIKSRLQHYKKAAENRGKDFVITKTVEAVEEMLLSL
ncbi:MAG: glycosyltransferase [Butyrivibrio sp.]|nr:glycosyltransferase [Butyrivibrio sp.]